MPLLTPTLVRTLARKPSDGGVSALTELDDDALNRHIRTLSHLKRFFERFCADPAFRLALSEDPANVLARYGLDVQLEDVHSFLEANDLRKPPLPAEQWSPNLQHFRDFVVECQGGLELIGIAASSTNARFRAWREREIARLRFDFSAMSDYVVRPALAMELSKGCTVGCWFCAISAERFDGNFVYNGENAREWRELLAAITRTIGPAAASGFCYWATDPLDNPDYDRFALDFFDITGAYPPTTTALALKKPAKTREIIEQSLHHGCRLNRFSVLTLPMLDRIHREFAPEELALVELVLQIPGSWMFSSFPRVGPSAKINAGRVLQLNKPKTEDLAPGTIACITGFLGNMIERKMHLVKPCVATQEWPLGYQVLSTIRFENAADLEHQLAQTIDRHMPLVPDPKSPVRFDSKLTYTDTFRGFRLSTPAYALDFDERQLGQRISSGTMTPSGIVHEMQQLGKAPAQTGGAMDLMYRCGVLA